MEEAFNAAGRASSPEIEADKGVIARAFVTAMLVGAAECSIRSSDDASLTTGAGLTPDGKLNGIELAPETDDDPLELPETGLVDGATSEVKPPVVVG